MNSDRFSGIFVTVAVSAAYFFLMVNLISTPNFNHMAILPALFTGLMILAMENEWAIVVHLKKIVFKSGVTATLDGQPNFDLPGNVVEADIWLPKRIYKKLKSNERLVVLDGGAQGFLNRLTGDVKVRWTGDKSKLRQYLEFELSEGGFFYDGSISGLDMPSEVEDLHSQNRHLQLLLSRTRNTYDKMKAIVDVMSKSQDKGIMAHAQQLNLLMKDILEAQQKQQVEVRNPAMDDRGFTR